MKSNLSPTAIVAKMMLQDSFSSWLGMDVNVIAEDRVVIKMKVTQPMLNGFAIAHGGISYSLADSCCAFAANSGGFQCVSIETSISHLSTAQEHDELIATSSLIKKSSKISVYEVAVINQTGKAIAHFKGTMFNTLKVWE